MVRLATQGLRWKGIRVHAKYTQLKIQLVFLSALEAHSLESFPGSNDMRDANFVGGLGGAACVAEQII